MLDIVKERILKFCMKKIGILTFHKSINYGSVLQAWALCEALENYEIRFIDYEPDIYKENYGMFAIKKGVKYNLNRLLNCIAIYQQIKKFSEFRKHFLKCTEQYDSKKIKISYFNEFDAIITGSDQIWNVHAEDADDIFFLPFSIKGKKIAYACSVNNTDFTEPRCNEKLRKCILDYDFISIREKSGADKVSGFIDNQKKVYTMLDPTLLHTKETFEKITGKRIVKKPYIFLYNVWSGFSAVKAAQKISQLTGLPVYTAMMDSRIKQILKIEKVGIKVETEHTSPEDFLSLIKYAELVVTESFHGTAFSLIFEKKFVCINSKDSLGNLKNDERIINILNIVGLENRYINIEDVSNFDYNQSIDYNIVTKKRMKEAFFCKEMLKGAIEGNIKS